MSRTIRCFAGHTRLAGALVIAFTLQSQLGAVFAGDRQFLVILANSPKQYPGPRNTPDLLGKPPGGLASRQQVQEQYFDTQRSDIGSFAEYWKEISYGDVTVHGFTTDWINLPWAIQPPLLDRNRDTTTGGPPSEDLNLDDRNLRNSPATFFDLDANDVYQYGDSERFNNTFSTTPLDLNGNPRNLDDGPSDPAPGGHHVTSQGFPVWKPGERFIDMDDDGRWDGLDEAMNLMDFNLDGRPDLLGPWIDLDDDGQATAPQNCIYFPDSDNDGFPDCCPNGPGKCVSFRSNSLTPSCPAARWNGASGDFVDCNGNLIPDPCDVSCISRECIATGWLRTHPAAPPFCGGSNDELPWQPQGGTCVRGAPDQVPDECQFENAYTPTGASSECVQQNTAECGSTHPPCTRITRSQNPPVRCEFHDSNENQRLDIPEPFENFLRRWDPCITDPDASSVQTNTVREHWVKVYDPQSFTNLSPSPLRCPSDGRTMRYDDPSYIRNNYPAQGKICTVGGNPCNSDAECAGASNLPPDVCKTGVDILISQAQGHLLYGQHDPLRVVPANVPCKCAIPNPTPDAGALPNDCFTYRFPGASADTPNVCIAGFSMMYDPPDSWTNARSTTGPGVGIHTTTKMRTLPEINDQAFLLQWTPKPGEYPVFVDRFDAPWFEQAWNDRYNANGIGSCQNPDFLTNPAAAPWVPCKAPDWPRNPVNERRNIRQAVPFNDTNEEGYAAPVNRRYFQANAGGLNGDGTGWIGCTQAFDRSIRFETGPVPTLGFEQLCNHVILPEEQGGASTPAQFFDGWVEHDDLPSSKYHHAGDQRLGEVTSPFSQNIWGEDRGPGSAAVPPTPDFIIPAAGPYAVSVHGNNGRDAGNQLAIELLTWRTEPPFNNGYSWAVDLVTSGTVRLHPYATTAGLGFRDYNLDGLIDQGETRFAGSENYQSDSENNTTNNGIVSNYPFNRDRLMEDCINILDDTVDFDDFVDPVAMDAVTCGGSPPNWLLPGQFWSATSCATDTDCDDGNANTVDICRLAGNVNVCLNSEVAKGVCSGIVLLPAQAFKGGDFNRAPSFIPIHNEDDNSGPHSFPTPPYVPPGGTGAGFKPQLTWNIFFHDLVASMSVAGEGQGTIVVPTRNFQTAFSAHEYLHSWQHYPDLYDYDTYAPQPQPPLNCPVGAWDIMSGGGLVHPAPVLKEDACTEWIKAVDLATVLTPGVDATLTLPRYEFVRDNSVYFLENENRLREKYWFWSVGSGFDKGGPGTGIDGMPGQGMLIMHTDRDSSNPDALPNGQSNGTRFFYYIVQADGLDRLDDCTSFGDAGDPWPGSANRTEFNFDTVPSATWYTQGSWTGIDIQDIVSDGNGSVQIKINWIPTSLPSLRFTDPPGGVSVPLAPGLVRYSVRFKASDVYGGTTVRLYYTTDTANVAIGATNFVGELQKTTPGTNDLSMNWNIAGLPDGRYYLFAHLIPGQGADGFESSSTNPRAGRNNAGNGTLTLTNVSTIARLETWTAVAMDAGGAQWRVSSSLTQPPPSANDPNQDPYAHALIGQPYTSLNGAVRFVINAGSKPFAAGDSFSFTTTGVTAPSQGISIDGGAIKEDPTARIVASPLSGDPPLTVHFDARTSTEPNGELLVFRWNFGDGSPVDLTPAPTHVYTAGRRFTVVLRATNPLSGRFGETAIDIDVTNNTPNAVVVASPRSALAPTTVLFNASGSTDVETPPNKLIYQWDFGDGTGANPSGAPGVLIAASHFYSQTVDGHACNHQAPCIFNAVLTVTDEGGKKDTDSVQINIGNTVPVVRITASPLTGTAPLQVTFNGLASTDADAGDVLTIDWDFDGDGHIDNSYPTTGEPGQTDGTVKHTYAVGTFRPKAVVKDNLGGQSQWAGVTITVTTPGGGGGGGETGSSTPIALFSITPAQPKVNEEFTVDGNQSFDQPGGGPVSSYLWDWGDRTPTASGVTAKHTYTIAGQYTIALTVSDSATPPNTAKTQQTLVIAPAPPAPENKAPLAAFTVKPSLSGQVGDSFEFDAGGSSDPDKDAIRFRWTFGDGEQTDFTSNAKASHAFDRSGTFVVRLFVRDIHNATTNASQTIRISDVDENRSPTAIIATGPRVVSQGDAVTFDGRLSSDPDGDALVYTWTFHRGAALDEVITGARVTKVFSQLGEYTVDLQVSDELGGVSDAEPVTVTVNKRVIVEPPPTEKPPPTGPSEEPPDSSGQRPSGLPCAIGMLPGFFASLCGLSIMRHLRRRR